jgi:hypothetical protein
MLIHIRVENMQPLAGTAVAKGSDPLPFEGWLELLRVISGLVNAAADSGNGDGEAAEEPVRGNETGR